MKIVMCDDNEEDLQEMERLLLQYGAGHPELEMETEKFTDAEALYCEIGKGVSADVYLLDMVMSEKNGIDLGRQIRERSQDKAIIYITSSEDYAMEAYGVHAVRYLLKPVKEESFYEALDYVLAHEKKERDPVFQVRTGEGLATVPYSRIASVESASRRLVLHLINGEDIRSVIIRRSFEEQVGELLQDDRFLQVHKSFVVNLNQVKRMDKSEILMERGGKIPISRARAADVKKAYMIFVAGKYA
jgi:DNA-binding LytR/AlgR family response regulator